MVKYQYQNTYDEKRQPHRFVLLPHLILVVGTRIELVYHAWEACILTIRWTHHYVNRTLSGIRTLEPLIKSQLLYQLS